MTDQVETPAKPPEVKAAAAAAPAPQPPAPESKVPANVWAYGSHDRQVPLAGALVDDPSLRSIELTSADWQDRVDAYLKKPA